MIFIRIIQRCTRGRFVPTLALWRASCLYRPPTASRASVRNAASFFVHFVGVRFCGGWCSHIFQWAHWVTRRGLIGRLTQWAGSFGISWCIRSLVKKTLHCRRAGFEPQRTSSFLGIVSLCRPRPIRIRDERERLVTASPVMTKCRGPSRGAKQLPGERPRESAET